MSDSSPSPPKPSSIRHTRAVQRARSKRPTIAPSAPPIETHLTELIHPATFAQVAAFHALGLRERILTLPVMMAFVLSLIWRQIGSVQETVRCLQREGLLWTSPTPVSPQAVEQRLRTLPAPLFAAVFHEVLPLLHARQHQRPARLVPALTRAHQHFGAVWAFDGSTLDGLLRKVGLLREADRGQLAGRMAALLDVGSRLPVQIWYEPDSAAHDQSFWPVLAARVPPGSLVLFDLGFVNHAMFDQLTRQEVGFVTRLKQNAAFAVHEVLHAEATLRDQVVQLGSAGARCHAPMRVVEVQVAGTWRRYLTNVTDPARLPAADIAALYAERWRIEDAFNLVKRVLGLAYFWGGASNTVQMQIWATWLLYSVLLDLTAAVADAVAQPLAALSPEMVFRGLYHYTQAYHRNPTLEVVSYLAAEAKSLGILKRKRRPRATKAT
jgi:hypothetical protein